MSGTSPSRLDLASKDWMLRSPDPPALLPLSWCESPTAPCRSLLPVPLDEPVLLGAPGEEDRSRAACFSARLAHGLRAALEVLMSSSMLSCMRGIHSCIYSTSWPCLKYKPSITNHCLAFLWCRTTQKGKRKDMSRTAGKLQGHASAIV